MKAKSWILVKALLNRFDPKLAKDFLSILPKEDSEKIQQQPIATNNVDALFVKPAEFLKNIHFSWIAPELKKFPQHIQEIIISSLPQPLSGGLREHLKMESSPISIPEVPASFFVQHLYLKIRNPEVLDPEFLPKTDLSSLLDMSRQNLVKMIDFLGLFDLAEEVKHIVEKKSLQSIYSCLKQDQMQFLRICLHQKSSFDTPRLDLQKWGGDCTKLNQILHHRGLHRLGGAITNLHPDFLWHLWRKLDTGRSLILQKYCEEEVKPLVAKALKQQVIQVLNHLK